MPLNARKHRTRNLAQDVNWCIIAVYPNHTSGYEYHMIAIFKKAAAHMCVLLCCWNLRRQHDLSIGASLSRKLEIIAYLPYCGCMLTLIFMYCTRNTTATDRNLVVEERRSNECIIRLLAAVRRCKLAYGSVRHTSLVPGTCHV